MVDARIWAAVDPGKDCGVAVTAPGRRTPSLHRVRGNRLTEVARIVGALRADADRLKAKPTVIIENQFGSVRQRKDGKQTINIKALQTLMRRRHEWEILCEVYGIEFVTVYPATWQVLLRQVPPYNPDGSKRSTKAKALYLAARKWPGVHDWTHDTADAALIGEWFRVELMQRGELF